MSEMEKCEENREAEEQQTVHTSIGMTSRGLLPALVHS